MTSTVGRGARFHHAFQREMAGEGAAASFDALDLEVPAMAVQRVFHDGEAESRSARLARTARIDPVEALGEPRDVLGGNAGAGIAHGKMCARVVNPPADGHAAFGRR